MFPLGDTKSSNRFHFWVYSLIAVNVIVFFWELISGNPDEFIARYALIPADVNFLYPQTLKPFVTSLFLHAGFLHIISNMWFLWIFGGSVEERLGFFLFPIFYIISGILGGFLEYIFILGSKVPVVGASGAIAGVLGAYYILFPDRKIRTIVIPIFLFPLIVDLPASVMLFYWFLIQIFSGTTALVATSATMGGIAYFAHIGGFLTGWSVGKLFNRKDRLEVEEGEILD